MLYLYALAAGLGDVADVKGVQGEPLVLVPFQDAVTVAGEITAVPSLDAIALKAQDALVRQLHDRSAALLPMRFGTTTADVDALRRSIDSRLLDRLAAVTHREQMIVRIVGAEGAESAERASSAESAGAVTGTAYLVARAKASQPSDEMRAIAESAAAIACDVRLEAANRHRVHGSIYHLIERGKADEYRRAVELAAARLPHVRVVITGPSPAYAFA
jgi:microcompartment protein CcmK/EutM